MRPTPVGAQGGQNAPTATRKGARGEALTLVLNMRRFLPALLSESISRAHAAPRAAPASPHLHARTAADMIDDLHTTHWNWKEMGLVYVSTR